MRLRPLARLLAAALATMIAVCVPAHAAQRDATGRITIEWDPNPESNIAGYVVYVGAAAHEYQQTFDVGNQTSFTFSEALAGQRYYFAVSAYFDSRVEGPRSNEVSAEVPASETSQRRSARCEGASRDCGSIEVLANGLAPVDSLAALDDGRLLLIEGGRSVRVFASDRATSVSMLRSAGDGVRLRGLAVDPQFERTHHVYLGVIDSTRTGARFFTVMRYRELNSALGEGAAIVSALPLASDADPMLAVDDRSRLYISMPGDAGGRDPYAGRVLRFNGDGSAGGVRDGSPIVADGYTLPAALAWDGQTMWSVGGGVRTPIASVISSTQTAAGHEAIVRSAFGEGRADRTIRAFAARQIEPSDAAAFAWLDDQGRLDRVQLRVNASEQLTTVMFDGSRAPAALALGGSGEVYAAVPEPGGTFSVVRLAAQGGKF